MEEYTTPVSEETDTPVTDVPEQTPDEGEDPSAENEGAEGENAEDDSADGGVDYAALAASDLKELQAEFPELCGMKNLAELEAAMRYAQLRDLGLTPKEAYLATAPQRARATAAAPDNRRHLSPSVPKHAIPQCDGMNVGEMNAARELFSGLSDGEIRSLYRRVNADRR